MALFRRGRNEQTSPSRTSNSDRPGSQPKREIQGNEGAVIAGTVAGPPGLGGWIKIPNAIGLWPTPTAVTTVLLAVAITDTVPLDLFAT